jgi:hypothetical protein
MFTSYFCSGEIDVYVTLHRMGAAFRYLYQYALPGSEIGGGYSHIGLLYRPGKLYLPAVFVPEKLMFM